MHVSKVVFLICMLWVILSDVLCRKFVLISELLLLRMMPEVSLLILFVAFIMFPFSKLKAKASVQC